MTDPRMSLISSVAGTSTEPLRERLERTDIIIDAGPEATGTFAGQVLLYQLTTLTSRLFDRVTLIGDELAKAHPRLPLVRGKALTAIRVALEAARPVPARVDPPTRTLRVLVGAHPEASSPDAYDLFVGCTGWGARLSVSDPQPIADVPLSVGALAAGALAASEVFKLLFYDVIRGALVLRRGGIAGYSLSLLNYGPLDTTPEPVFPEHIVADMVLFGCGSIGCAVVLGLLSTPQLTGQVVAVDNGIFDEHNPYKYTLLDYDTAAAHVSKAQWARRQISKLAGDRLHAEAFDGTAYEYVASLPMDYRLPLAISAVDTIEARMEIQDTLPGEIINAGIAGTMAEVSVHGFGDGACLACLAIGQSRESWSAKPIADSIGLPEDRVHSLIVDNAPLAADDITRIRASGRVSQVLLADLDKFVGQPVLSFYNRVLYSEAHLSTATGTEVRVTTAFVSALAGVLVLAEFLKASIDALEPFRVDNSYRHELMGIPSGGVLRYPRDTTGRCACHSAFRQLIYRTKYSAA